MSDCNAELHIADDFGDNHATIRCQREEGHEGSHREVFRDEAVIIEWIADDFGDNHATIRCQR